MNEFTTPEGTRDLILQESYTRKQLQLELEDCFQSWGYQEVTTPMIEYYNTYNVAQMKEEQMYKFFDASGKILTLRPDMTIPIARVAATKFKDASLPLRFRYSANVFKVNEKLSGNKNEICDCGVELIGVEEPSGDLQILACAIDALSLLGDIHYTLEIGNINFFQEACRDLSLNSEQISKLATLIDKKSLKSLELYVQELGLDEAMQTFFMKLPWLCGGKEVLEEARKYAFNDRLVSILDTLETIRLQLAQLGYEKFITFDLGKVARLHYYTGLIFEAFVAGVGMSILSGGRYDALLKCFGKDLAAIGFSVRLDALLDIITRKEERKRITLLYPKDKIVEALEKAGTLRKNFIVELQEDEQVASPRIKEEPTC